MCRAAVEQFLDRRLADWPGLPTGCAEDDIAGWLAFRDGEGLAHYGSEQHEYRFRVLADPRFRDGVDFHFAEGTLRFIAAGYWSLDKMECDALVRALGRPAHTLPLHWKHGVVDKGEWLYLERGLALGVIPDTRLILKAIVFPRCDLAEYERRYYQTGPSREFPE